MDVEKLCIKMNENMLCCGNNYFPNFKDWLEEYKLSLKRGEKADLMYVMDIFAQCAEYDKFKEDMAIIEQILDIVTDKLKKGYTVKWDYQQVRDALEFYNERRTGFYVEFLKEYDKKWKSVYDLQYMINNQLEG